MRRPVKLRYGASPNPSPEESKNQRIVLPDAGPSGPTRIVRIVAIPRRQMTLRLITLSKDPFLSVTVLIEYPTITAHSKYAPPKVRPEFGGRSTGQPACPHSILAFFTLLWGGYQLRVQQCWEKRRKSGKLLFIPTIWIELSDEWTRALSVVSRSRRRCASAAPTGSIGGF
jgi:hypothetical protein